MRPPVPRPAVRVLLALALLLVPSSAWAVAHPTGADGRTGQVAAHVVPSGEQAVQPDRQHVAGPGAGHRRGLGGYRLVLLGVLAGVALLPVARRWWSPAGTVARARLVAATLVRPVRAPPRLLSA